MPRITILLGALVLTGAAIHMYFDKEHALTMVLIAIALFLAVIADEIGNLK